MANHISIPLTAGAALRDYQSAVQLPSQTPNRPKILDESFGIFFEKIQGVIYNQNYANAHNLLKEAALLDDKNKKRKKVLSDVGVSLIPNLVKAKAIDSALFWVRFFYSQTQDQKAQKALLANSREAFHALRGSGDLERLYRWLDCSCDDNPKMLNGAERIDMAVKIPSVIETFLSNHHMTVKAERLLERGFVTLQKVEPKMAAELCSTALRNTDKFLHEGLDDKVKVWADRGIELFKDDPHRLERARRAKEKALWAHKEVNKIRNNNFEDVRSAICCENYMQAHHYLHEAYSFAKTPKMRQTILSQSLSIIHGLVSKLHETEALFWVNEYNKNMPAQKQDELVRVSNSSIDLMSNMGHNSGLTLWLNREKINDMPTPEEVNMAQRVVRLVPSKVSSKEFLGSADSIMKHAFNTIRYMCLDHTGTPNDKQRLEKRNETSEALVRSAMGIAPNLMDNGYHRAALFWCDKASATLPGLEEKALARQLGQKAHEMIRGEFMAKADAQRTVVKPDARLCNVA